MRLNSIPWLATCTLALIACDGGAQSDSSEAGGESSGTSVGDTTVETSEEESEAGGESSGAVAEPGAFDLLTYNVAGLPQGLSSGDPEAHMHQISPHLNDFDIALVQEDFWYHSELSAMADHPHVSTPWTDEPSYEDMGDGLNRFSQYPFDQHERVAWWSCNGTLDSGSDCLATKGWAFARHTLDEGVELDVYNLHMEAGGAPEDEAVRDKSADDLIAAIAQRSEGRAVIVAGDFNLHEDESIDLAVYNRFVDQAGLEDACWAVNCGVASIDRVLFRSSAQLDLAATSWDQPSQFADAQGDGGPLSDHLPTAVHFEYTPQ